MLIAITFFEISYAKKYVTLWLHLNQVVSLLHFIMHELHAIHLDTDTSHTKKMFQSVSLSLKSKTNNQVM